MSENNYGLPEDVTAQSLFDKSARHLLGMTEACAKEDPGSAGLMCNYRDYNGSACAIGCLISDDDYDPKIEEHKVSDLFAQRRGAYPLPAPSMFPAWMEQFEPLMTGLQSVHDNAHNRLPESKTFIPSRVREHLRRLASDLGLKADVIMEVNNEQQ